jgi:chaperonin cofactor prefoldin
MGMPPEVQAMLAELDAAQERLSELQALALEGSPELQAEQEAIQELVDATFREVEPEFDALLGRLQAMEGQAMAAQQAQNLTALEAILSEAEEIQERLGDAQAEVFAREEVSLAIEAFRDHLKTEMTRLDPEAPALMDRMEALVQELDAILGEG